MPFLNITEQFLEALPDEFWQAKNVIVAVSGGSDSMALLTLLAQTKNALSSALSPHFQLIAFHFDHQWRPESAGEAQQVCHWASQLGFQCMISTSAEILNHVNLTGTARDQIATDSVQQNVVSPQPERRAPIRLPDYGLEGTARFLRYEALKLAVSRTNAQFVLTGHTWNDQAETILMRLARGTGLDGLSGIARQRPFVNGCQLLRPLLTLKRTRLRTYLAEHQQAFIEDPSNQDQERTRNQIRHQVLPWLEQNLEPNFTGSLIQLANSVSENQIAWHHLQDLYADAVTQLDPFGLEIKIKLLNTAPEPVVRQLLVGWWKQTQLPAREMNHAQWVKLTSLVVPPRDANGQIQSQWPSQFHFPGPVIAQRSGGILIIKKPTPN